MMSDQAVRILQRTLLALMMTLGLAVSVFHLIVWSGLPTTIGLAGSVFGGLLGAVGTIKAIAADPPPRLKPWPAPPQLPAKPPSVTVWQAWTKRGNNQ